MNGIGTTGGGYTGIGITGQDVLIYGNLLVSGGIDPIYLALTPRPSGPQGFTNPLWVDNIGNLRSDKILIENTANTNFTTITPTSVSIQDALGNPTYTNTATAANITLQDSNSHSNLIATTSITITDGVAPNNIVNTITSGGSILNNTTATDIYTASYNTTGYSASRNEIGVNAKGVVVDTANGIGYSYNDPLTLDDVSLTMKLNGLQGEITCVNLLGPTNLPINFVASALTLNNIPITNPNINQVLLQGTNAGNQSIANINNVELASINSNGGGTIIISNALNLGSNGVSFLKLDNDMNANGVTINNCQNINTNQINGASITSVGLLWSDFTGTSAYAGLPSQTYSISNLPNQTDQTVSYFRVTSTALNGYSELAVGGLEIRDLNSSTSTSYGSNNISSTNGTAFTIMAGSGASQPLNLNCSQLVINGSAYPPAIPTLRPLFYSSGSGSFSIGSSVWATQGTIYTFNMTPNTAFVMSVNFIVYTDSYESTGAMYLNTHNSITTFPPSTYTSTRPVARTGESNTFSTGGTSQFVFNDTISFTSDNNGQLKMDLYLGHNGGTWSGNYNWSMFANILSP